MIKLKEKEVKLYKNLVFLILNYSPEEANFILKYVGISVKKQLLTSGSIV